MSTADLKMYCCGFLLAAAGLFIRLLVSRRRFGRRGPAGLQYFSSYGRALITLFAENMLNYWPAADSYRNLSDNNHLL